MSDEKASRPELAPGTAPTVKATTYSGVYALRRRNDAARRLPALDCGHYDPLQCCWVDCDGSRSLSREESPADDLGSDYYHDTWLDRGYAERDDRGRELAAAGWVA